MKWTRLHSGRKEEGTYAAIAAHQKKQRTRTMFYFFALVAVVGWLYVFFESDALQVRAIEIYGAKNLDPVDVKREVYAILDERRDWRPWPARQMWFIDPKKIQETLKDRLFLANAVVDKKGLDVLRLTIEERANKFIFHSHQQYLWVDLQGMATSELTDADRHSAQGRILGSTSSRADDAPIIHRDLSEPVAPGYRIASADEVRDWIKAARELTTNGLAYRELTPPDASSTTAGVMSSDGYRILIDFAVPLARQIKTYEAFKRAGTKTKVSEYVDVRIPGRVYVK